MYCCRCAGNLCLSPRVSTAESEWLTFPRLTTFTTPLNATDVQVQYGGGRHDHYKRLSSSGYDACFSTPSNSNCVVVDQSSKQCTCHELHGSMSTTQVPSHYEHLQMNSGVSGRSLEHQRRLQLISQNPVMSLRRLHSSTSQPRSDDDIDQLHELTDQQLVVC